MKVKKSHVGLMVAIAAGLFAAPAQALFEPGNLEAVAAGTGLDVTWDHNQVDEYTSISYDLEAIPIGTGIGANNSSFSTSASLGPLTPGTDYRVWIQAFAAAPGSQTEISSSPVLTTARTAGARPYAPDAPSPTCTFAGGSLTVTWPAVHYATGYESSLRTGARGSASTDLGSGAATTRTWSGELQSETTYFVDVRTVNSGATATARNSAWAQCSFTPSAEPETPTPPEPETPTPPEPETPTPPEPETPTPPTPEAQICTYEHRLSAVPSTTQSYTGWIRVTSRVSNGAVRIRAYRSGDGSSLDVLDEAGEVVQSLTRLGPANSTSRFRIQDVDGWHSVVVAHSITVNSMNGVTVTMMVRGGPQGLQFFPADVVESCTSATTAAQVD